MSLPNLADLEALMAVAASENLRIAARTLGISQPALSIRLQKIEQRLSFPIFQTQGRRKRLSPRLLPFLEGASRLRDELARDWERFNERELAPKDLECRIAGRRELLLRASRGAAAFPGAVTLLVMDSRRAVEELEEGRVELAISHYRPPSHALVARKLFEDSLELVVPRAWRNATPAELMGKRTFALLRGQEGLVAAWARDEEIAPPRARFVADDWSIIAGFVERGEAWTIAPSSLAIAESSASRRALARRGPSNTFHLLARKERLGRREYREFFRELSL